METTPLEAEDRTLYEALAGRLCDRILEGTLKAGDRTPSIRRLSRQFSVSKTTVRRALQLLEDRGLVEARDRSGYYVRPERLRRPSAGFTVPEEEGGGADSIRTRLVGSEDLHVRMIAHANVRQSIQLGAAIPCAEFLPTERLARILSRVSRERPRQSVAYTVSPGAPELRRHIARRAVDAGLTLSADDVVITNGATEAVSLSLRAICGNEGIVAVESPTYYGFLELLDELGLDALEIDTDPSSGMKVDALRDALDKGVDISAVLLVSNGSNPLGSVMPDEKKAELARVCAAYDVPIVEDDIYGELHFGPRRPLSIGAFSDEVDVVWCGSFSKSLAPGWRVGWVAPGDYIEDVVKLQTTTTFAPATPTQLAVAEYLASGGFDRHLGRLRRRFSENVERISDVVLEHFPDGTTPTQPRAGHVLWVRLPATVSALELTRRAQEHGVSIAPGPLFSATGAHRSCIRLNCAVDLDARIVGGLKTVGQLACELSNHAPVRTD